MMWTRKELKTQAKEALQRNYWKIVLVSFLSLLFCDSFIGAGGHRTAATGFSSETVTVSTNTASDGAETNANSLLVVKEETYISSDHTENAENSIIVPEKARMVGITIFVMIAVFLLLFLYILNVLLIFPLRVGVCRFMIKSMDDNAKVKEITYGFDHSYKNVVKTMFHCDIRIFLWALLFVIPGFYKQYQYRMVPYILAGHPDMDYREVLKKSASLMNGHKWKAFLLDLSFLPWHLLGLITCGTVEIFYTSPYYHLSIAALYRRLSDPEMQLPEQSEAQI
ncbi:MAG: DUF975 family protein [Lachnospiraceae bacterium]|nr:DUF975 family protein [Lachnospiraceae bacterium]